MNNNIPNEEDQMNLFPENIEVNEEFPNIYNSIPLPINHSTITHYTNQQNIENYSYNQSKINNIKKHAKVVPINDELMKNPYMAKKV